VEDDMKQVAGFLHRAVQLSIQLQKEAGTKMLKDFVRVATQGDGPGVKAVRELGKDVKAFARKWPLPGADISTIQRPAGIEEDD
jgi:glycine hydroxymethyltransferase